MNRRNSNEGSRTAWFTEFDRDDSEYTVDGLVRVDNYDPFGRPPEEVATMERARIYDAHSVFFEAARNGRPPIAQAFVFVSTDNTTDSQFAQLHRRLWSWGGVPLLYRKIPGQLQLFRCAHEPDFVSDTGEHTCRPFRILDIATHVADLDAWWDADQLRNGTLWDDPQACRSLLSERRSAHRNLVEVVRKLHAELSIKRVLTRRLRRRLLILSLLIAYLEERGVLQPSFFSKFLSGARSFFQVLRDGEALVGMIQALKDRFNGNVFSLSVEEKEAIQTSTQLVRFAQFVEGYQEPTGQIVFWRLYSFKDLPVELLSNIYQLFVRDSTTSVYTPANLVRLILEEALPWDRLDSIVTRDEIILDPACGSGIFLVEAYKRLVLHWRSQNLWARPSAAQLRVLLDRVHGVDLEEAAVELAEFSLCLALCDSLELEEIRDTVGLFPVLVGTSLHHNCFFEWSERMVGPRPVGTVLGNPPFKSALTTPGAQRTYDRYTHRYGHLADRQLAYLFLHEAKRRVAAGGILAMIQPAGFLYNKHARTFRDRFFAQCRIREILDFVSVRGLFKRGNADTKVVVVVATNERPDPGLKLLHAVFRRSGRATAQQVFDIDYYDMHWIFHSASAKESDVWRANLLGGGRLLAFLTRLRRFRTLGDYVSDRGWEIGEGYIAGQKGISNPSDHLVGKPLLPTTALSSDGIDSSALTEVPHQPIEAPRSAKRFTPPLLLIKKHEDLHRGIWDDRYLAYQSEIVGLSAPVSDLHELRHVQQWLSNNAHALQAYAAGISIRLFTRRATSIGTADIMALPYPEEKSLHLSENEHILVNDVVNYGRDLIRKGNDSIVMKIEANEALEVYTKVFVAQIRTVYPNPPLVSLDPYRWPGIICQPFSFGPGNVDWTGAEQLRDRLDSLLREKRNSSLTVTRIARIYDRNFVFLLKPDRLRFWLRSIALRDADDVRADLRAQGF